MKQGIYAIVDTKTCEVVGGIQHILRHVAPAIRMFESTMTLPNFAPHKNDYQLWRLGYMQDAEFENPRFNPHITADAEMIMTGAQAGEQQS